MSSSVSGRYRFTLVWWFSLVVLTGCGLILFPLQGEEKTTSFTVSGGGFDEAFVKAIRAAEETGLQVTFIDRQEGSFRADRGLGYAEITYFEFLLTKSRSGTFTAVLKVQSSKAERVADSFVNAYGKYVTILR